MHTSWCIIMITLIRHIVSLFDMNQTDTRWHYILRYQSTVASLRQSDLNISRLQDVIDELSASRNETFPSVVMSFTTKLCLANDDNVIVISYMRAVLEVFVLYSISTNDQIWLSKSTLARLEGLIEQLTSLHEWRKTTCAGIDLRIRHLMPCHHRSIKL